MRPSERTCRDRAGYCQNAIITGMTRIVQKGLSEVRPWGSYEVLSSTKEGQTDKVTKKITVQPGKRLSLQSHQGREEAWTFLSGEGEVTIGDETRVVKEGVLVVVPKETKHRISNMKGTEPLVFIEVSTGFFDEDDIVRYDDDFGRVSKGASNS